MAPELRLLGGRDIVTNTYSFVGELLGSKREHKTSATGETTTILTTNGYDHVGRLVETRKKVNSQAEVLQGRLEYNGIGQLVRKRLHSENGGTSFIDTVGYTYNERGWMARIGSPNFTQELRYNDPLAGATAQYNGNIAQSRWEHAATVNGTTTQREYIAGIEYSKVGSGASAIEDGAYRRGLSPT